MKNRLESIEFFTSTDTVSDSGFITSVPVSYWLTRAEVKPLSENRKTEAFQTNIGTGYTFKIRYRRDKVVTKSMQVVYQAQTYTIHEIKNVDEAGKELQVTALGTK